MSPFETEKDPARVKVMIARMRNLSNGCLTIVIFLTGMAEMPSLEYLLSRSNRDKRKNLINDYERRSRLRVRSRSSERK